VAHGEAGVSRGTAARLRNGIALQGNTPLPRLRNGVRLQADMRTASVRFPGFLARRLPSEQCSESTTLLPLAGEGSK